MTIEVKEPDQVQAGMATTQWIGFMTIVRKETIRVLRIWPQTLLPSVITTTLYFLVFGSFIGDRIGEFDGYPYIQFIIPGLIMMSVITNSYSNVSSSLFGAKFQGNVEEMLVSPLSNAVIVLGYVAGGMIRGSLVGLLVMGVSMLFAPLVLHNLALVLGVMLFTSMLFSLGGFVNAMFARNFDDVSIVPTFVLTPLTYLGGVFYSISLLPDIWQTVSRLNPILYLVNLFRYGFLGVSDVPIFGALTFLLVFVVILWSVCLYLLNRGVGLRD